MQLTEDTLRVTDLCQRLSGGSFEVVHLDFYVLGARVRDKGLICLI